MRWTVSTAVGVLLLAASDAHSFEAADDLPYGIFQAERPITRRHRGDWEPPDSVIFTFEQSWSEELAAMVGIASAETHVRLLVDPRMATGDDAHAWMRAHSLPAKDIGIIFAELDTPWVRDYGPLQVFDRKEAVWLDPIYGGQRPLDDVVPLTLSLELDQKLEALPIRFDGGAIMSNGAGLCASTHEFVEMSGASIDEALLEQLGCPVMVLLPALVGERTHHVDMFAQFLALDVVAVAQVDPKQSPLDAARMDAAAAALIDAASRLGFKLDVVRVPLPYLGHGEYRTYLNGLPLQNTYLAPSYSDVDAAIERRAFEALSRAMPRMNVVGVPADPMIRVLGALHCVSLGLSVF